MEANWTVDIVSPNPSESYDQFGNPIPGTPTTRSERVYGWAPAGAMEDTDARQRVEHDLDLYAPPSFTTSATDKIVVLGASYDVVGNVEDFNYGPFGFTPGVRVNLKRVSG